MTDITPGWQPDPTGRHDHRYWDGSRWTDDVADAGVAATDPYDGPTTGQTPTDEPDAPAAESPTTAAPAPSSAPTATGPAVGAAAPPPSHSAPPPPVAPTAASSGSKRGLLIGIGVLVLVALAVGAVLLLGEDDESDRDRIHAGLVSALNEDGALSAEQVDCLADHLIDEIGEDELGDVDFSADEPPAELQDEYGAAALSGMDECEIDMFGTDGSDGTADDSTADDSTADDSTADDSTADDSTADDSSTDDSTIDDSSTDLGTDGVISPESEEMLADFYAESFGISQEEAECLAGRIVDALGSGELSEDEMMGEVFGYLEECDISLEEMSGGSSP